MSNYPDNFKGIEGEKEKFYIFEIIGKEAPIESTSEEYALEELLGFTLKEAINNDWIQIDGH